MHQQFESLKIPFLAIIGSSITSVYSHQFCSHQLAFRTPFNLAPHATLPNNRLILKWVENFRQHGNVLLSPSV